MYFDKIPVIEDYQTYIDYAFRKAVKKVDSAKIRSTDRIKARKERELIRLFVVKEYLTGCFHNIIKKFPSTNTIEPFYQELIKITTDFVYLKKSLGAVDWCNEKIISFYKIYRTKIAKCRDTNSMQKYRKEYYGRVNSCLKQIRRNLSYLEECRKIFRSYPHIKNLYTVCIFGFPNVGKSTLLTKLTDASPEIATYAFTTKSLNLGYLKKPGSDIQIIDAPGTLNRLDKMNNIEKQAHIAVNLLADIIVFVIDPTQDLDKQYKLFKNIKGKKVLIFVSKTDVAEQEFVDDILKKYTVNVSTSAEDIKQKIITASLNSSRTLAAISG